MHLQIAQTLLADLETDDSLELSAVVDQFRMSTDGHVLIAAGVRYESPDDFTLDVDGAGLCTLIWKAVDTLNSGVSVRVGVALIDAIIGATGSSSTGGTFDSTGIGQPDDPAATTDTENASLVGLFKRYLQRFTQFFDLMDDDTPASVEGPTCAVVSVTPVVSVSPAYVTGDAIGSLMTFEGLTRGINAKAIIQTVLLHCKVAQTGACDLIIFNANPTNSTFTDNSAFVVAAADLGKVAAIVKFATSDWASLGTPSAAEVSAQGKIVQSAGDTEIYAVLVARATFNVMTGTSDVNIVIKTMPDIV